MRKYLALAQIRLVDISHYRAELLLWQLIDILPLATIMLVLTQIPNKQMGKFSINQLISYYLLSLIISRFISYYFSEYQANKIRTGEFSKYLMIPMRIGELLFVDSFVRTLIRFALISAPFLLFFVFLFKDYFVLPSSGRLAFFLLILLMANVLNFLIQMIMLAAAFYLKTIEGLKHAQWIASSVLGGSLIPISFLPGWLQKITEFLPFRLFYFVPISIYMGKFKLDEMVGYVFQAFLWIVVLTILCVYFWKMGLKKYSAVNG